MDCCCMVDLIKIWPLSRIAGGWILLTVKLLFSWISHVYCLRYSLLCQSYFFSCRSLGRVKCVIWSKLSLIFPTHLNINCLKKIYILKFKDMEMIHHCFRHTACFKAYQIAVFGHKLRYLVLVFNFIILHSFKLVQ